MFRKSLLLALVLTLTTLTNGLTSQIFQRSLGSSSTIGQRCYQSCENQPQPNFQSECYPLAQFWNFSDQAPSEFAPLQPTPVQPEAAELTEQVELPPVVEAPTEEPAVIEQVELPQAEEAPAVAEPAVAEQIVEIPETIEAPAQPVQTLDLQVAETLEAKEIQLETPTVDPIAEFASQPHAESTEFEYQWSHESEEALGALGLLATKRLEQTKTVAPAVFPGLDRERGRRSETLTVAPEFATAPVSALPTQATKTIRSSKRTRKAAAGWWLFPLLLLPLLGLFLWQLFGNKDEWDSIVAEAKDDEQELDQSELEGSFSASTVAAAKPVLDTTDLEVTDLEIETVESGLESTTAGLASQAGVASLQTTTTTELETEAERETREYRTTAVEEDLETEDSRPTIETRQAVKSDEQNQLKIVSADATDHDCDNQERQGRYCCDQVDESSTLQFSNREEPSALETDRRYRLSGESTDEVSEGTTSDFQVAGDLEFPTELSKIEGLSAKQIGCLGAAGIYTLSQFKNTKPETVQRLFVESGLPKCELSEVDQWYTLAEQSETKNTNGLRNFQSVETSQNETSPSETRSAVDSNASTDSSGETSASSKTETRSRRDRTIATGSSAGSSLETDGCDDLTKIRGIGPATARLLNENGITRFEQMADIDSDRLQQLLDNGGPQFQLIGWSTWTRQARFISQNDWKGLDRWLDQNKEQLGSSSLVSADNSSANNSTPSDGATGDDLTRIKGIGPAATKLLRENGITRFEQLTEVEGDWLQQLLENAGPRFRTLDWSTWSRQASFAITGDWKGRDLWLKQNKQSKKQLSSTRTNVVSTNNTSSSDSTGEDDLTRINGIGPASAELLRENGITRFEQLVSADQDWLENLFTNSGTQFTTVQWTTWSEQAQFATKGDWDGLREWFNTNYPSLRRSQRVNKGSKSKRSQRLLNKRSNTDSSSTDGRDNLTLINGIGPASAKLLRENGITNFEELMSVEESRLENLFRSSGTQFSTWRRQARFASTGDWDGLREWYLKNESAATGETAVKASQKPQNTKTKSDSSSVRTTRTEGVRSATASDNLTVINGIGPATAKVLKANGITRFEQIAVMTGAQLESIISGSGARFQLVDPTSWPQQAIDLLNAFGRCDTTESSLLSEINELQSLQSQRPQVESRRAESVETEETQPSQG